MEQVLQQTLQEWLDAVATLHIDIVEMSDMLAPHSAKQTMALPSTLFILDGEVPQLAELWQLTKQLEALPIVYSWKYVGMPTAPQQYSWFLLVILAIAADQWNFLEGTEMDEEDSE